MSIKKRIIFWLSDCPYKYRGHRTNKDSLEKEHVNKFLEFRSNAKIIRDYDMTLITVDAVTVLDKLGKLKDDVLIESYALSCLSFDLKLYGFDIYIGRWFRDYRDVNSDKFVCGILELKEHMEEINKDLRYGHNLERLTTGHKFDYSLYNAAIHGSPYYDIIYNAMKDYYKKSPERNFRKQMGIRWGSIQEESYSSPYTVQLELYRQY